VPLAARQAIRAAYLAIAARAAATGLSHDQTDALRARAGKESRSMQQIVCSALDDYLMRAEDDERTDRLASPAGVHGGRRRCRRHAPHAQRVRPKTASTPMKRSAHVGASIRVAAKVRCELRG
jgi:hypothetical protein